MTRDELKDARSDNLEWLPAREACRYIRLYAAPKVTMLGADDLRLFAKRGRFRSRKGPTGQWEYHRESLVGYLFGGQPPSTATFECGCKRRNGHVGPKGDCRAEWWTREEATRV